jgi:hypothetical protein
MYDFKELSSVRIGDFGVEFTYKDAKPSLAEVLSAIDRGGIQDSRPCFALWDKK